MPDCIRQTIRLEEDFEHIVNNIEDNSETLSEPSHNNCTQICCICGKESSGAHKCKNCQRFVHNICGQVFEEKYGEDAIDEDCYGCCAPEFQFLYRIFITCHVFLK